MNLFLIFELLILRCLFTEFVLVAKGISLNGITSNYNAQFDPSQTDGAIGTFGLTLQYGEVGYYQWKIDLNNLIIPTKLVQGGCTRDYIAKHGLKYHIHAAWNESSPSLSSIYSGCDQCQGHYDPYLACSEKSIRHSTLCTSLHRTLAQSYKYNCNSTVYTAGHLSKCEVGDLSGKFGVMGILNPTNLNNLTFIGSVNGDYNPPVAANYLAGDSVSTAWASLVLHCPIVNASVGLNTPALICAKLVRTSNPAFPSLPPVTPATIKRSNAIGGFFNASFTTAGGKGTFALYVDGNGIGSYFWNLSLAGLTTLSPTNLQQIQTNGIKYHIHVSWNDTLGDAATICSGAGGHYDPFLACSSKSQDAATLCPLINRTATLKYSYGCNTTSYALANKGHLSLCEVGDLSGKNGLIPPSSTAIYSGSFEGDPNPPLIANFRRTDLVSLAWASVVLHLPQSPSPAFLCARLLPVTLSPISTQAPVITISTQAPITNISTQAPVSSSSSVRLSGGAIAGIVIAVIVVIIGLVIGSLLLYNYIGTISPRSFAMSKSSQKSTLNDGYWQRSNQVSYSSDRLSSGPSRVSFGLKGVDDVL